MKIKVSYSELKSGPGFNNRKAEAELEVEVNGDIAKAFEKAWRIVKDEVQNQLDPSSQEPF